MSGEYPVIALSSSTKRGALVQARRVAKTQMHINPTDDAWAGWKTGEQGFYWTVPAADGRGQVVLIDHGQGSFSTTFVLRGSDLK